MCGMINIIYNYQYPLKFPFVTNTQFYIHSQRLYRTTVRVSQPRSAAILAGRAAAQCDGDGQAGRRRLRGRMGCARVRPGHAARICGAMVP